MKISNLFCLIGIALILVSCKTQKTLDERFRILDKSSISQEKREETRLFTKYYFENCTVKENDLNKLSERIGGITSEKAVASCKKMTKGLSEIDEIFLEQLRGDGHSYIVYRYKVKFQNGLNFSELRLIEKFDGKFVSFAYRDKWRDIMTSKKSKK